jgi:hypothetical protein
MAGGFLVELDFINVSAECSAERKMVVLDWRFVESCDSWLSSDCIVAKLVSIADRWDCRPARLEAVWDWLRWRSAYRVRASWWRSAPWPGAGGLGGGGRLEGEGRERVRVSERRSGGGGCFCWALCCGGPP